MSAQQEFDLIVIGSGLGGLATASILAQIKGWRVLVLERHYTFGGLTQTFRRPPDYSWDVGLHYVGEMQAGSDERAAMDFVTGGGVGWNRMPEPFEVFTYPDFRFAVHGDEARYRADLRARFPDEAANIDGYFREMKRIGRRFAMDLAMSGGPALLRSALRVLGVAGDSTRMPTTGAYLERRFKDPRLRALVASQWGDYGLPPDRSCLGIHALTVRHYLRGAYYPEGGAAALADAVGPIVEAAGGLLLANRRVTRIIVENGRAVGVDVAHRRGGREEAERYRAPVIVSDAGAHATYGELLPREPTRRRLDAIEALGPSPSAVSLFLGLNESPETLGFHGENHWIYESYDHDRVFAGEGVVDGRPEQCYLSFPSLKSAAPGGHTAEIVAFTGYERFAAWAEHPWRRRGGDYKALKARIAEGLLDLVERHHPGFRSLVAHCELATPVTVEHFTGSRAGSIYGLPATPERYRQRWLGVRTPVPNVFLTGADTLTLGIVGVLMSGIATAGTILGPFGFFRVMAAIQKQAKRRR